jgi:hypothetical protein
MFKRIFLVLLIVFVLAAPGCIYLNGVHNTQLVRKMHQDWLEAQLEFDRWFFGMPGE